MKKGSAQKGVDGLAPHSGIRVRVRSSQETKGTKGIKTKHMIVWFVCFWGYLKHIGARKRDLRIIF